jgi:nicotinamidase-related amidase
MNKLAALCFGIEDIYKNESNTKEQEVLSFLRKVLNYDVKLFFVSQSKENKIEANDIVRDTEDVIYCSSPNAFLDSDLDKHLKKNEISHIILLGKMYPMVMEATSYNAYFHGYQVIALEDMMISETNEEKQDFFSWFNLYFGLTYTYDDLFKAIETGDVFTVKDVEIP